MSDSIDYEVVCVPKRFQHIAKSPEEAKAFADGAQAMVAHMAQYVSIYVRSEMTIQRSRDFESTEDRWLVDARLGAAAPQDGEKPLVHMLAPSFGDNVVFGFGETDPLAYIKGSVRHLAKQVAERQSVVSLESVEAMLTQFVDSCLLASHPMKARTE